MSDQHLDLASVRTHIDAVDRELVSLLSRRARLVEDVIRYKRANHLRVVDRQREDAMLARIGEIAKQEGLDPRVAQAVLRTVIDSFTLLEAEVLEPES